MVPTNGSIQRRLCYVLPKLEEEGSEHFAAVPGLLKCLASSVSVVVVAERAIGTTIIPGVGRIDIVGECSSLRRIVRIFRLLERCRREGIDRYFVRISRSAVIVGLWCRLRGGRLFYWHSGAATYRPWRSMAHFKDWLRSGVPLKLAFLLCHRLVTGPRAMVAHYVEEFDVPEKKIVVLPNDVDVHRFSPISIEDRRDLRIRLGLSARRIAVMVHRLSPVRRLSGYLAPMLQALVARPEWTLVVVGGGPERRVLERIVAKSRAVSQVRFVGAVSHSRVSDFMRAADIFVNPSYVEGFPRVVIEAMASGLPMVVTDAGGTAELLPDDMREWVVSRDDWGGFGQTFGELLDLDAEKCAFMSRRLRGHAKRYGTEHVAREYLRVLFSEEVPAQSKL